VNRKIFFLKVETLRQTLSLGCHIHNGSLPSNRVSRVRVTLTVMVRVSRVSVMVIVRDSVK